MTVKEFSENELLFNKLYEKTKDCGRTQFVNLLMQVERENQELKKQLEEMDSKLFFTKNELEMRQKSIDNKLRQQKEFIEWLEDKIKNYELPLTDENKKALGYTLPMKGIYKEVLEKYKELIGDNNVKDIA